MTRDEYEALKRQLGEQLEAGVRLLKAAHDQKLRALDQVWRLMAEEGTGLPPAPTTSQQLSDREPTAVLRREDFTDRERQVLDLLVDGITSNRRLAQNLGISENSVKLLVRGILDKLHVHNRAQIVPYAIRNGLVKSPVE